MCSDRVSADASSTRGGAQPLAAVASEQNRGWIPPGESPLETGTPRGLPSLTGFVINEGLIAGDEAA
jgi:hypothetical protein